MALYQTFGSLNNVILIHHLNKNYFLNQNKFTYGNCKSN